MNLCRAPTNSYVVIYVLTQKGKTITTKTTTLNIFTSDNNRKLLAQTGFDHVTMYSRF